MRKCLLILGLLSSLLVNAQVEKPAEKTKEDPGQPAAEPPAETARVSTDYRFPDKNLIIAHQVSGNNIWYALLEYGSHANITPFVFERFTVLDDRNLCMVRLNEKFGVIDLKGQLVIPCIYDEMEPLFIGNTNYFIVAQKNGRYGIIDAQRSVVIPIEYEKITKSHNATTYAEVVKNSKAGLMDLATHKMVIPAVYDEVLVRNKGLVQVKNGLFTTLFNLKGEKVFSDWYTQLYLNDNLTFIHVEKNGRKGLVDLTGKQRLDRKSVV